MDTASYRTRRGELETYFDRTASETWARLTSEAPVSRIRETVRSGRNRMRATLLDWLPLDLRGHRLLDAGCGTGALSVEAARRGAHVTAIDVAPTLISIAQDRVPRDLGYGQIDFRVGDMLDPRLGRFDHVVAMDSLIHYDLDDIVRSISALCSQASRSVLFTVAPRTPALTVMHAIGKLFPRGDRAPAIQPVDTDRLGQRLVTTPALDAWSAARTARISSGFYKSHALELLRE